MGNANDLARTLRIPTDCAAACQVIVEGKRRPIDLGWVNGTHFFNVASMGLSVRIARRLTRDRKQRWGVLAYLGCAWEALHEQRPFWARVVCDGLATELHSMQITVGNGRHYGGGMTIVDDATIDDGRLDLYALPRCPLAVVGVSADPPLGTAPPDRQHRDAAWTGDHCRNRPAACRSTSMAKFARTRPLAFASFRVAIEVFVPSDA